MSKHKSGDHRVNYGEPADREAEQLLAEQAAEQQAVIAPGTNGDPNDPLDDFPTLRDAGEAPDGKIGATEAAVEGISVENFYVQREFAD